MVTWMIWRFRYFRRPPYVAFWLWIFDPSVSIPNSWQVRQGHPLRISVKTMFCRDNFPHITENYGIMEEIPSNPCYPSWWPSLYKTSSVIWWSCAACQSFSSEGKTTAFIIEKAMILHVQHVWWCLSLISEVHSWMQGVSHFLWKVEKTQQDVMYPGE